MDDTQTNRKEGKRKTYKITLNLNNPVENHIYDYIEKHRNGNASGNIKKMLMEYISWDRIMNCGPSHREHPESREDVSGHASTDIGEEITEMVLAY